jgi:hypothetical protein
VTKRTEGLQAECDLLSADLVLYEAGERKEEDFGPNKTRIDLTDIWMEYLRARLALNQSMIRKLKARYKSAGLAGEEAKQPAEDKGREA